MYCFTRFIFYGKSHMLNAHYPTVMSIHLYNQKWQTIRCPLLEHYLQTVSETLAIQVLLLPPPMQQEHLS